MLVLFRSSEHAALSISCRRYNNVLMDEERKMQMEMFLGIKHKLYFPTLHVQYRCVAMDTENKCLNPYWLSASLS